MSTTPSRHRIGVLLIAAIVVHGAVDAHAQRPPGPPQADVWTWKDGTGQTRTAADFSQLLARHERWLATSGAEGAQANLANANLQSLRLSGAHLENAVLTSADLSWANLTAVNLSGADLGGVTLVSARLQSVSLEHANISGAFISQTDMPGTQLQKANISSASVVGSNLRDSNMKSATLDHTLVVRSQLNNALLDDADLRFTGLMAADLAGAKLYGADLEGAVYEPLTQPELRGIANAFHLDRVTFITSPDALTALRRAFLDGGYIEQRRSITYALKHQENELLWRRAQSSRCAEPTCRPEKLLGRTCANGACEGKWLNYVAYGLNLALFDWTVRYGLASHHALVLLAELWLLFSLIYFTLIHVSSESALVLVKRKQRRTVEACARRRFQPREIHGSTRWRYRLARLAREWHVLRVSMFFSLLTTFHNGFNDLDPGKWIRLLTKRDYNLEPEGWMRTVAGIQTVVSLFLFAMWVLTQFGQPFEA